MNAPEKIFVHGLGAVSPAGWGVAALQAALTKNTPIPTQSMVRPGWEKPLGIRNVPPPEIRPAFFSHPRLRRASDISLHTVAAAIEALGEDVVRIQAGNLRLGIVVCTMAGGVAYSRRFYEEVLREPALASPQLFPETVFNAPASHLAAYLNSNGTGYTLVGDDGTFLQGLAVAADWLLDDRVDGVVVVGAEEMDWVVTEAIRLFQHDTIHSAGAGAIYLRKEKPPAAGTELAGITDSFSFTQIQNRTEAARKMRVQLPPCGPDELLCASAPPNPLAAAAENAAWRDWSGRRLAPKSILGEGFTASAAWQCVAACNAVASGRFSAVNASVVGANQQAIGARFRACAMAG
jgi:3-oxoacyl-(acyl-carrier-protein) synthase